MAVSPFILQFRLLSYRENPQLVHFQIFYFSPPFIEGSDIRCHGIHVDSVSTEDDTVLTLVSRNFYRPVNNDIQTLFVNRQTVGLIIASACVYQQFIQRGICQMIVVAVRTTLSDDCLLYTSPSPRD